MVPMSSKRKQQEKKAKEELLADDAFAAQEGAFSSWLEKNIKVVVGVGVLVLGGVVAMETLSAQNDREASTVTTELNQAVEGYQEATELRKVLTSTSADVLNKGFAASAKKFESIGKDFPKHEAARLALLYQADLARRQAKHEEAEKLFKSYLDGAKPKDAMIFLALEGAGYSAEAQDKGDNALGYYKQLAEKAPFYKDYSLKHQARVLEKKGDTKGAIAAYKSITEMKPESKLKRFAEDRLKALE